MHLPRLPKFIATEYRPSQIYIDGQKWLKPRPAIDWGTVANSIKSVARHALAFIREVAIASDITLQSLHMVGA